LVAVVQLLTIGALGLVEILLGGEVVEAVLIQELSDELVAQVVWAKADEFNNTIKNEKRTIFFNIIAPKFSLL
jgi:hypothetical protein